MGCGVRPLRPEPLPVGQVTCSLCGMVVSLETQSAQWIAAGEEPRFYDDIGCLATDPWTAPGRSARFVHVAGAWSPAEASFYARPPGASTPMGYGAVAFTTREEAASRDAQGRSRTWVELVAELRASGPGGAR